MRMGLVEPRQDNKGTDGFIIHGGHHLNQTEFGKQWSTLLVLSGSIYVRFHFHKRIQFVLNWIDTFNWLGLTFPNQNTFQNILINRLPWNQHTYIGYIGDMIFASLYAAAFFTCNGSFILFFISICLHLKAFSKMFQHTALEMSGSDQSRNNKQFLIELIQFHVTIKK